MKLALTQMHRHIYSGLCHLLSPSIVCVCVAKVNEREIEREDRWNRVVMLDPPLKMKYRSLPLAIKACQSSITLIYQDIKDLTDVKRVNVYGDEEG